MIWHEKKKTVYRISVMLAKASSLSVDGEEVSIKEKYFFRFDGKEHDVVLKITKE